jgi:hypothetical protein
MFGLILGGLSAMFFGVANLVIHSIFDTDHRDWRINNTSFDLFLLTQPEVLTHS